MTNSPGRLPLPSSSQRLKKWINLKFMMSQNHKPPKSQVVPEKVRSDLSQLINPKDSSGLSAQTPIKIGNRSLSSPQQSSRFTLKPLRFEPRDKLRQTPTRAAICIKERQMAKDRCHTLSSTNSTPTPLSCLELPDHRL